MTFVTGGIAQLLHIVLMAVAAPTLVGVLRWMQARLAGQVGPPVLQPWRDLLRLWRKQRLLAESASLVSEMAPAVAASATVVAACLVPSFALGMTLAPLADLLVILGLLAAANCALALAAMDAGIATSGMVASRTVLLGGAVEPALLLVLLVLGLTAGSLNLDLIAAMQIEAGADWRIGGVLGLAAALLVALVDVSREEPLAQDLSGADLAAVQTTAALRLLVWLDLIGAMFLPVGMARPGAGPVAWVIGAGCWLMRTLLFAVLLAVLRTVVGRIGLRQAMRLTAVAMLLGLAAAVLLFTEMGTA